MTVNAYHVINDVFHEAGRHELTRERAGSRYVLVAIRTLVDPADAADAGAVVALQDQMTIDARSAEPFVDADYDEVSLDATRTALLTLANGMTGFARTFGSRDEIDPIRHLIGTAAGWAVCPARRLRTPASCPICPATPSSHPLHQ